MIVFAGPGPGIPKIPGAPQMPVTFLLPFLLWAAVRFGPPGASLSLLATALLAISAATGDTGPFNALPPAQSVPALQVFLLVTGVPVMYLAALIRERRNTERIVRDRLKFEETLSGLSRAFVHVPSHEMDLAFESWLARLTDRLELDRLILLQLLETATPRSSRRPTAPSS
jgi:hypothetical protein